MTIQSPQSILILGAGLTGLTAAYHLTRQGYRVTLLDHPGWQDGFRTDTSDAAPILFGCHHETWRLLRALDSGTSSQPDPTIPLEFWLPDGRVAAYRSAHLPGALQWMMSLFSFHGLAWHDRWKLFTHLEQIWEQAQSLPSDLDSRIADEWLASSGQSQEARDRIWDPLAQWLTGNALTRLSASIFVQTLSTVFLGRASDSRITHLQGSVGDRLTTPLRTAAEQLGATVQPQPDLPQLRFEQHAVNGVQLKEGTILKADWYVAALPHQKLLALLPERLLTRFAYFAQMAELAVLSDITIQFTCRSETRTPRLLLVSKQPFHRLTVTSRGPHEVMCRLSVTGNASLAGLSDDQLIDLGRQQLHVLLQKLGGGGIQSIKVLREEHGALSLQPGAAALRPVQKSPIHNLLVAGAWTDTGWPANAESAVVSARRCANFVAGHPA